MVIISLMGGLGNQMFQFAFGLSFFRKTGLEVVFDLSYFNHSGDDGGPVKLHPYGLDAFILAIKPATREQIEQSKETKHGLASRIVRRLTKTDQNDHFQINGSRVTVKHSGLYIPELFGLPDGKYIAGYFQTEKYFKDYGREILRLFSLKTPLDTVNRNMLDRIRGTISVSLHVRRGDYLNLQHVHGLCDLEYYRRAVEYIENTVSNPHFYLFSDDIPWVKENLTLKHPCTIVDYNNDRTGHLDLELMKHCRHNIIANSTFSWWGAWLNDNQDKTVIAPSRWFTKVDRPSDDIIPETWITI